MRDTTLYLKDILKDIVAAIDSIQAFVARVLMEKMMHIEHVALWTRDLERLKTFYETYFGARSGPRYVNPDKGFMSYFLTFASGARLELMQVPGVSERPPDERGPWAGYAHLAVCVGSEARVEALTARLRRDGYRVLDGPRWTGDGYYESRVLDPDGNPVEITVCNEGEEI